MTTPPLEELRFDEHGLVPVVVQDAASDTVLMLAFMNQEALRLTQATGEAHYWSRTRQRLWRKGERSGNTQAVVEIRINCERNSMLLLVRQTGAVCHDGYATCYYRQLANDGSLSLVRDRVFDPEAVYGRPGAENSSAPDSGSNRLAEALQIQFGAYEFLKQHDLAAVSATSRRLRSSGEEYGGRVGDELRELAGVLVGIHQHGVFREDVLLEASQALYWIILESVRRGEQWRQVRPDRAFAGDDIRLERDVASRLLIAESERWDNSVGNDDFAARAHATLALVAAACRSAGINAMEPVAADLAELRTRSYLRTFFQREDADVARGIE